MQSIEQVRLGLRANWQQFWLLVLVNAFVGGMVGLERAVLPLLGERDFGQTLRPQPFYLGVVFALGGLLLSVLFVRDSHAHARQEAQQLADGRRTATAAQLSFGDVVLLVSWKNRSLLSVSQAGLVNNLNDGLAWGLFPLYFAASGLAVEQVGVLAAVYPGVWGVAQLGTGALSDRLGRKGLIVAGMWTQALGMLLVLLGSGYLQWMIAMVMLGLGTALVYPTLLASISDVAHPEWRASAVGVYRLWRDGGYAVGALLAGVLADLLGVPWAIAVIAALTCASGVVVLGRMDETLPAMRTPGARRAPAPAPGVTR